MLFNNSLKKFANLAEPWGTEQTEDTFDFQAFVNSTQSGKIVTETIPRGDDKVFISTLETMQTINEESKKLKIAILLLRLATENNNLS